MNASIDPAKTAAGPVPTGSPALTRILAEFSAGVAIDRLPEEVVARARLLMLDLVGNVIRARHDAESTPALLSAAAALGFKLPAGSTGGCGVFGDPDRWTPAGAALLNGALGHSLDFDDTHAAGSLHPGCPVIPAALAAAEMTGASGRELLAGIVAGYEVICRVALALPAHEHYDRGFHPTATCGAFGAAAAAGRVLGLSADGIASAFGIALSQTAGSLQFLSNGAWTKRFQVGWSALSGLSAALLAREGFKGAAQAFEGQHGFLRAYAPSPDPSRALDGLGERFELMATAVKPYPSCRFGHAGIDAAIALRDAHGLRPEEIEEATLGLSRAGLLLVGEPVAKRANPENVVDGQFSGPFVVSVALATGRMGWDSYALLTDPTIRAMLPKVTCRWEEAIERERPANMSGRLVIRARGQTFEQTVIVPKGEPSNFLTENEIRQKFSGLADEVLGDDGAGRLADAVLAVDRANEVGALLRMATPRAAMRLAGD